MIDKAELNGARERECREPDFYLGFADALGCGTARSGDSRNVRLHERHAKKVRKLPSLMESPPPGKWAVAVAQARQLTRLSAEVQPWEV